ncbi:MAG: hypothetical protein HY075_01750, partial [Deltaproteobacteria bacterium]|nr:hypothetical protein [Deltaproteobacteria bacterium]
MLRSERPILVAVVALVLGVWVVQATHWNSLLDADSALYSLMSTQVLKGYHYVYTCGQAHGGTPLVYLRALLFRLFGASHFLGFYVNGAMVAVAAALWARFAFRLAGPVAALVTGTLAAVGSQIFAQYSLTDYYVLSLVAGGLMLDAAWVLARRERIATRSLFWLGLLGGFSFYVCRFTPLYALLAFAYFLAHTDAVRRASWLPTLTDLKRARHARGWLTKLLVVAFVVNSILFFPAFLTDDRFLGINAESTLKLSFKLLAALWFVHRWPLAVRAPLRVLTFAAGAVLGFSPHFLFLKLHPEINDRLTGLVRWSDLAPKLPKILDLVGADFSRSAPLTIGLAGAGA